MVQTHASSHNCMTHHQHSAHARTHACIHTFYMPTHLEKEIGTGIYAFYTPTLFSGLTVEVSVCLVFSCQQDAESELDRYKDDCISLLIK